MRGIIHKAALAAVAVAGVLAATAGTATAAEPPAAGGTVTVGGFTINRLANPHPVALPNRTGVAVSADTLAAAGLAPQATTAFTISNGNSGKVMEVFQSSTANGGNVDQWDYNGTLTQFWVFDLLGFTSAGEPVYNLINANSGKCAEVFHSNTANGANVDQWQCNGTATQMWIASALGAFDLFTNVNSGKVMEVFRSSTANGGNVDQWQVNGTPTQLWFV